MQLDAGGFAKGYGPTAQIQTTYLVKGLLELGYDAINLSYKEFYKGGAFIKELEKNNKFNFLAANIYYADDKAFTTPYVIKNVTVSGASNPPYKKLRVGILGLCDQREKLLHRAANEPQIKSIDPVETAKKLVPTLQKKSDIVILMYHGKYRRLEAVLKAVKGIDIVTLGGEYYSARQVMGSDAIIVSTPSLGKHLSSLTVELDAEKNIISHKKKSIALSDEIDEDARFLKLVQDFEKAKKEQAKNRVRTTSR